MRHSLLIALDADGVLLDYHKAYQKVWGKAFGTMPVVKDPLAYWPKDRYDVRQLSGSELSDFRRHFDEEFWSTIPPIEHAVNACKQLAEAGFNLICVSALDHQYQAARLRNLKAHDFPIEQVIATPQNDAAISPKVAAIKTLGATAFVDDYLPYFRGIPSTIHRALILREPNGSPNRGAELTIVDTTHENLQALAKQWIHATRKQGSRQ